MPRCLAYDISGHQKGLDVEALLTERAPLWMCVKLTEAQGFVDKVGLDFARRIVAFGTPCSGYGFLWANRSGAAQGTHLGTQYRGSACDARPVADIEGCYDPKTGQITDVPEVGPKKALATYVEAVDACEQVTGRTCNIYTGPGFIQTYFSAPELRWSKEAEFLAERPLWCAHYGASSPIIPLFWRDRGKTPACWQWSGGATQKAPINAALDQQSFQGRVLDTNLVLLPEDLGFSHFLPQDLSMWKAPAVTEIPSIDQILELVRRPGGQEPFEIAA